MSQANSKTERFYVEQLAKQLNSLPGYKAYCHRRPIGSKPLREYLAKRIGFSPILQPELDLVVRTPEGKFCAIEVKYFRRKSGYYTTPYYLGIGQALALAGFGFDHVGLWYLFEDEDMEFVPDQHGSSAWILVRKKLRLPMEFSFFAIRRESGEVSFDVMTYKGEQGSRKLIPLNSPRFLITWKNPNPLIDQSPAKEIREALDLWIDGNLPKE